MANAQRDEARTALAGAPGLKGKNEQLHSPAAHADCASISQAEEQARVQAQDQRVGALRARGAALGWTLHVAPSSGFLAARWGRVRELADLGSAEAFLAQMEKRHA